MWIKLTTVCFIPIVQKQKTLQLAVFSTTGWRANNEGSTVFAKHHSSGIHHTLQVQQMVNMVELFGTGKEKTFLVLTISGLARTIEASRILPARKNNSLPVTSWNSRHFLRVGNFACVNWGFYMWEILLWAIASNLHALVREFSVNTKDHQSRERQWKLNLWSFEFLLFSSETQIHTECL